MSLWKQWCSFTFLSRVLQKIKVTIDCKATFGGNSHAHPIVRGVLYMFCRNMSISCANHFRVYYKIHRSTNIPYFKWWLIKWSSSYSPPILPSMVSPSAALTTPMHGSWSGSVLVCISGVGVSVKSVWDVCEEKTTELNVLLYECVWEDSFWTLTDLRTVERTELKLQQQSCFVHFLARGQPATHLCITIAVGKRWVVKFSWCISCVTWGFLWCSSQHV